jgi:hypothetical protein
MTCGLAWARLVEQHLLHGLQRVLHVSSAVVQIMRDGARAARVHHYVEAGLRQPQHPWVPAHLLGRCPLRRIHLQQRPHQHLWCIAFVTPQLHLVWLSKAFDAPEDPLSAMFGKASLAEKMIYPGLQGKDIPCLRHV